MSNENEAITINDKILQYGILSNDDGYVMYVYPGMTVAEIAFDVMVTIRLLLDAGHLKSYDDFINLISKYYNDPQYLPVKKDESNEEH